MVDTKTSLRSIVNDRFRELTLHRNPEILQTLPARKQHESENTPGFTTLEDEIEALAPAKTDPAAKDRQGALMAEKRKLVSKELLKCQKLRPSKLPSNADDADLMGYHRTQFQRVRRLLPKKTGWHRVYSSSLPSGVMTVDPSSVI
jgi:hypothetical protein